MSRAIKDAMYKVGTLLIYTGWRMRGLSKREPTLKDLAELHETLTYSAEAVFKIARALLDEDSREKHRS